MSEAVSTRAGSEAFPGLEGWTLEQSKAADEEGWNLFDCSGPADAAIQMQADDEAGLFKCDQDVWRHVVGKAGEESELHRAALDFLEQHSRKEHTTIIDYVNTFPVSGIPARF